MLPAMDNDIPPLTHPRDMAPVRTQADLQRLWRTLMGELGFGGRSLWLSLLEPDGQPTPVLLQIEDLPQAPSRDQVDRLTLFCETLLQEMGPGQIAFLLSGPGRAALSEDERRWAGALEDVQRRLGGPGLLPVHRANDRELAVIAPDEVVHA
jgi:hypothetical protein